MSVPSRAEFIVAYRTISGGDDAFAGEMYDILSDPDPSRLIAGLADLFPVSAARGEASEGAPTDHSAEESDFIEGQGWKS